MEILHDILSNLWAVFLIVLFFGGSIFVHELGHFLVARWRGMHVDRFSIGFGPKIFSWTGKDGVDYRLSWLPLGGYVALPQLADMRGLEGETTPEVDNLPPPSYTTKVLVSVAGAVFNILFAFALACVIWMAGLPAREDITTTRIGYVFPTLSIDGSNLPSPALKADLRPGDVILAVDGNAVSDWNGVTQGLALGSGRTTDGRDRLVTLKIKRGETVLDCALNPILAGDERMRRIGVIPSSPVVVASVPPGSKLETLGFKPGDQIVTMDNSPVYSLALLGDYLESHASAPVVLGLTRESQSIVATLPAHSEPKAIAINGIEFTTRFRLQHQNPFTQIDVLVRSTFQTLGSLLNRHSDIGISKLSGPIGIATSFWDASKSDYPLRFAMWFTVLINVNLAIFNLLPIPVLDGGHILFATISRLRGRALPAQLIATTQSVFIVLLFSMILYVSIFDVRRLVRDTKPEKTEIAAPATPAPARP